MEEMLKNECPRHALGSGRLLGTSGSLPANHGIRETETRSASNEPWTEPNLNKANEKDETKRHARLGGSLRLGGSSGRLSLSGSSSRLLGSNLLGFLGGGHLLDRLLLGGLAQLVRSLDGNVVTCKQSY